jgi:hypothetical protein
LYASFFYMLIPIRVEAQGVCENPAAGGAQRKFFSTNEATLLRFSLCDIMCSNRWKRGA